MTQKITSDQQDSRAAVLDGLEVDETPVAEPKTTRSRAQSKAPGIYGQIVAVMAELQVLTPDKTGPEIHQSYPYVSSAKVTAHLRQLLAKHKIAMAPRVLDKRVEITFAPSIPSVIREGEHKDKLSWRGKIEASRTLAVVEMEYTFFSALDGSSMVVSAVAESADTGDKALSKAITTAYKKAMLQTFMIVSEEPDVDYGNIEEEVEAASERSVLRDRGEQARDRARNGRKSPQEAIEGALEAKIAAEEQAANEASVQDPVVTNADTGEVAEEAPAAPAPASAPEPEAESTDSLADAKKALRESVAARAGTADALTPVDLDALAEKLTGKQRADWIKSARDITKIVAAVEAGEKP